MLVGREPALTLQHHVRVLSAGRAFEARDVRLLVHLDMNGVLLWAVDAWEVLLLDESLWKLASSLEGGLGRLLDGGLLLVGLRLVRYRV